MSLTTGIILLWLALWMQSPENKHAGDLLADLEALIAEGKESIPSLLHAHLEEIEKNPQDPRAYVLAAALYSRRESRSLYEKALELSPDFAPAHLGFARHLAREGDASRAFSHFKKAVDLLPGRMGVRREAVAAAVRAGRPDEARNLAGADTALQIELVHALIDASKAEAARSTLKDFGLEDSAEGESLAVRGRLEYVSGQKENNQMGARRGLSLLLESWTKSPELLMHYRPSYPRESLVQILNKAGRREELGKVVAKGLELYPREYPLYEVAWKATFAVAQADYTAEREAVRSRVEEMLRSHPAGPDLYKTVALGFRMAGLPQEEERINRLLSAEFPYSPPAMWVRRSAALKEDDVAARVALLERYNRDFPNFPMYSDHLKALDELGASDARLLEAAEQYLRNASYAYLPVMDIADIFMRRQIHLDRLTEMMWVAEKPAGAPLDAWDVRVLTRKGKLLLLIGKIEEAETTLRALIDVKRQGMSGVDSGAVKFRLAEVLEARNMHEEALELYAQGYAESQHYLAECGDRFRSLYRRVHGGDSGMEEFLSIRDGMYAVASGVGIERGTPLDLPAPEFELLSLNGGRISLSSLGGRVIVLNFWATWCGPCIKELPHLQEFHDRHKDNPGVAIVTITTDENRALVEPFIRKHKYTFMVLFDEGLRPKYEVRGIPTTFIIDASGRLRLRMVGFNINENLVEYLEKRVAEFGANLGKAVR